MDTGSTDATVLIARGAGCRVEEVGTKFINVVDQVESDAINQKFIIGGEENVVKAGSKFFHFADARNHCASFAKNDVICWADADEVFTAMNIDAMNAHIKQGFTQFEYNFVYAHDEYGNEAIKFVQSKMYDRRICKWVNGVHEVLAGPGNRVFLPENLFKLEHFQIPSEHRGNYLPGLAIDCFRNPDNDRNSHYFARELMYCGRYKSAIHEFNRHIAMNRWHAEKAQSLIFSGDCFGKLGNPLHQVDSYNRAIYIDGSRREAFIKLARFYKHNNNPQLVLAYTKAAMEIDWMPFYANEKGMYEHEPHELLYWAYGWSGKIGLAKKHLLEACKFRPLHPDYLRDAEFYFDKDVDCLPTISIIIPQLGRPEGLQRMLNSIQNSDYPQYKIQVIVVEGPETVPVKVHRGLQRSIGAYIVYAANDTELLPNALRLAVKDSRKFDKALVAFDTGVRNAEGYICEHFMIRRDFVHQKLGGVIFDLDFHHVGVDDLLWKKCEKWGETIVSEGRMNHYHYSRPGASNLIDDVIKKGWGKHDEDRELLKRKLAEL